jgi:hypothetical protein
MDEIERRLRRWRVQRWRALWSEGGTRFAAPLAGYLLVLLILDRSFVLRQDWRWALFWLGAAAFAFGAWVYLIAPLAALRSSAVLRAVSKRWPELSHFLLGAWELGRGEGGEGTSEALAREHMRRTTALLRRKQAGNPFPWKPSRDASRRFLSVAACWAIGLPAMGGRPNFQRVLAPWKDVPLERRLSVRPGDAELPWGRSVEVSVSWRDRASVSPPDLSVRSGDGDWGRVEWDRREGLSFYYSIESLTEPHEYRFEYEGVRTRVYRLSPIPVPRLERLSARVHLPGAGPRVREIELEGSGRIAALRRSWVVVRGLQSRELDSAKLEVSFLGQAVAMKAKGGGWWEAGFPLNEDGRMRLLVTADDGSEDPAPVSYTLRALEDAPPVAELLSPAFELEISRKETLPVAYEAEDDYGLSEVALVYSLRGSASETVIPLKRFRDRPGEFLGDYAWDLSAFPVGAVVEFRIRATDDARPDPQTAASGKGVLRIVDFESAHARTAMHWLGAEAALDRLAEREAGMQELLEKLAAEKAPLGAEDLERLNRGESDLDAEWGRALERMNSLAEAMRQDAYANPGMTEASAAMKGALESLRRRERENARRAASEGRLKEAKRAHADLEKKVRRAGEMLNAGRELQAMQDFWGEAHRMERAGKEISGALDRMAEQAKGGKAPSSEQKRALDEAMRKLREQIAAVQNAIGELPETPPESERAQRRKVYSVPLLGAKEKMDALQEAISRGDYEEAARIAKRLAQQLQRVHEAIAKAAQDQARGGGGDTPSRRMEQLASQWADALQEQRKGLEMTDALENSKLESRMREQKKLLKELAERQRKALKDAGLAGRAMPGDAFAWMRSALEEFEAEKIREAPKLIERAIYRLEGQARRIGFSPAYAPLLDAAKKIALPWESFREKAGEPARDGDRLAGVARQEREILEELRKGAKKPPMTEGQLSQTFAAGAVQRQASRKTEDLERQIRSLSDDYGVEPGEAAESLSKARAEQANAEASLKARDSAGARAHQRKAIEHLSEGKKSLQQSLQQQQSISQGSVGPFQRRRGIARPAGRGGRTGQDTGFVPLPGAEDYQPPRQIREEVERSLREKRPRVFDDAVDEYLKRMSQ